MKTLLKSCLTIVIFGLALIAIGWITELLNAADSLAVLAGTVLVLLTVVAAAKAVILLWRPLLILLVVCVSASGCTRIGAGYVGIKISQAGDNRGVNEIPVTTGWVFYNPLATDVFEYPTFMQTAKWEGTEEVTFATADQMRIAVDMSIGYQVDATKVPAFYVKFRSDNLDTFTHGYMRNLAREVFDGVGGKYKIDAIMGDNSAFLSEARTQLQLKLDPIGVKLDQFGLLAAPRPPQQVIDMINGKVAATQLAIQKENELRAATADAAKEVAKTQGYAQSLLIRAQAEAEGNRIVAESLTLNLIDLRRIEKWNGQLPQVHGAAVPLFNLK